MDRLIKQLSEDSQRGKIKCVIWDLDHTLWSGILSEGDQVALTQDVKNIIETLDSRGILQSVASKNNAEPVMEKLEEFGLSEYFLYPQIGWQAKSQSIQRIADNINIGKDTLLFIDDQPFEREEVSSVHPEVSCADVNIIPELLSLPALNPRFITDESKMRRQMYMNDSRRNKFEESFEGPKEAFLDSLDLEFTIDFAKEQDLQRLEELVARTNQLNTTGRIYNYEELDAFRLSDEYIMLTCSLNDKYGSYGKIGLALIHIQQDSWTIIALLMSCRVMARGVGSVLLNYIINSARLASKRLIAEMIPNNRNRQMQVTYRFTGFQISHQEDKIEYYEHPLKEEVSYPDYVAVVAPTVDVFLAHPTQNNSKTVTTD